MEEYIDLKKHRKAVFVPFRCHIPVLPAMHFPVSSLVLFSVFGTVCARTGAEVASYFRKNLSKASDIYLPSGTNYTLETTQRWNAFSAPTYILSVKPATDVDIQKIVSLSDTMKGDSRQTYRHKKLMIVELDRICLST